MEFHATLSKRLEKVFYVSLKHATNANKSNNSTISLFVMQYVTGKSGLFKWDYKHMKCWSSNITYITRTWPSAAIIKVFILPVLISCFAQEWKPGLTRKFLYGSGLTHKTQNRTRRIFCFSYSWFTSFSRKHPVWQRTETRFWLVRLLILKAEVMIKYNWK